MRFPRKRTLARVSDPLKEAKQEIFFDSFFRFPVQHKARRSERITATYLYNWTEIEVYGSACSFDSDSVIIVLSGVTWAAGVEWEPPTWVILLVTKVTISSQPSVMALRIMTEGDDEWLPPALIRGPLKAQLSLFRQVWNHVSSVQPTQHASSADIHGASVRFCLNKVY